MNKISFDKGSAGICHPKCIFDKQKTVLKITLAALAVLLLFLFAAAPASADDFFPSGGDGTADSPFQINSAKDLQNLSLHGNELYDVSKKYNEANYKLMNNLDLSSVCGPNVGGSDKSWTPIGSNNEHSFKGTFDGDGHTISSLYISASSTDYQGLFGYTEGANIKNLGVTVVSVKGNSEYVGGLVGWNDGGTIENCYATGKVTGSNYVGGLVGRNIGTIKNCYATVGVKGSNLVGGLVGESYGDIENCYATGAVEGNSEYVGGLVGNMSGSITNCYATGAVTGRSNVGGLVGGNDGCEPIAGSVALNPSVSATASEAKVGRVVGSGSCEDNCYAWNNMTLSTAGNLGGAGIPASSSDIWGKDADKGVWGWAGFDTTGKWGLNLDSDLKPNNAYYQLPVLKDSVGNLRADTVSDAAHLSITEGDGSETNAYKISGPAQLHGLALLVNEFNLNYTYYHKYYNVTADIDLSTVCSAIYGSWTPIGKGIDNSFYGTFNGNNHTISNLYINSDKNYLGLFGYTDGANIKNLGLTNVNITGDYAVGGLVGQNGGAITNCYATGAVTGSDMVGGLVGNNVGSITNCYATGAVTGSSNVGGLVGFHQGTIIHNCYATGTVTGTGTGVNVGGLVGSNGGRITNSLALNPSVSGSDNVGRVVGSGSCDITCYAWEGMTNRGTLFSNEGNNGTNASSAQVWNNISFYSTLWGDISTIWELNITNQKYLLPVLKMNPDTSGLDASYLAPIDINVCNITVTNVTYNGMEQSPIVNVSRNGVIFIENTDYIVTGNKQTSAGDYQLTIKGIGSLTGIVTKDWNISKAALSADNFTYTAPTNLVYDGTAKTAKVEAYGIYGNGTISITYHNETTNAEQLPIAAGTYKVNISVVEGANYTAADNLHNDSWKFTIEQRVFSDANITFTIEPNTYVFDGTAKTPTLNVTDKYTNLKINEFTASGNTTKTAAGEYTITVTGTGNYTAGTITKDWNITTVKEAMPTAFPLSFVYNGTAITLPVSYNSTNITASNLTFTAVGEYTAEFELKDKTNYTWLSGGTENKTINWNITKAHVTSANFTFAPAVTAYNGTARPVIVTKNNEEIGDITIKYNGVPSAPTAAGTYNINISVNSTQNYTGADNLYLGEYKIEPRVFSDANITFTIEPNTYVFDGTAKTPSLNVTDILTSTRLTENVDYTVTGNRTETAAGTYNINITGKGNYTAESIEKTWSITQPIPTQPSGRSTDTGSGNFNEHPRTVTDGGFVSFGTSPTVSSVDLPKGVSGSVILVVKSKTPGPDGKPTYIVFEINIPNYPEGEEAVIQFRITLEELKKAGYDAEDICLYHCDENGVWTALPTTFTIKDGIVYYEAVTTEFSPFAIVFEENGATEVSQPAVTPVKTQTAEPVSTYVEPTKTAVPTPEQTKSPVGLVGLGLGLLGAFAVLRRK